MRVLVAGTTGAIGKQPAREMRALVAAIRQLEQAVLGAEWTEGIVLRYGAFYGPGTSLAPGGEQFELARERKFPLVGDGGGVWSQQPMQAPRLAAGEAGAVLMTELRGASNVKAKRELGWQPRHPSWRQGFAT
jgi:hypothetical protein